ncbi:hypothetical protein [Alishewanella longhuensis]
MSREWINLASTAGVNPQHGFANWFFNPERKALPSAPETAITFQGAGRNIIYL